MAKLTSFRDLRVYQELRRLHLEVHAESMKFPRFELYELGSQLRRSSNSAPAILAEGWGSRHTNVYIEAVNMSMGEVRKEQPPYRLGEAAPDWEEIARITQQLQDDWQESSSLTPNA